jgi:hypothetical protein
MLKNLVAAFTLILFFAVASGCHTRNDTEKPIMTSTAEAMKGYELYSWKTDDEWNFALLPGTNRLKTFAEVSSSDALRDVNELKERLSQLTGGAEITWVAWTDDHFSLPAQSVIDEVSRACNDLGLTLTIAP